MFISGQSKMCSFLTIQVNLDITDSVGPGKLVRHMQNTSYTLDWEQAYRPSNAKIRRTVVRHMQKSVVQWSVISKFTCILENHSIQNRLRISTKIQNGLSPTCITQL